MHISSMAMTAPIGTLSIREFFHYPALHEHTLDPHTLQSLMDKYTVVTPS